LVKQGFVLRRQDAGDRRRVVLSLASKGRRVYEAVIQVRDAIEREFLSVLAPVEIAALYNILDKLEARSIEIFSDKRAWRAIIDRRTAGIHGVSSYSQRSSSPASSISGRNS
jgi:hypothetical protein